MKKFLTLVVALAMVIPAMAIGRNDGSTKANAIDFDWEAPMTHPGGPDAKWYRVDLAPLYEEETPALNLFLANKDAFNDAHTSLKATVAGQTEEKSFTIGPKQQKVWSANATMLVRLKQKEIYLTLKSDGSVLLSARVFEAQDLDETCKDALNFSWATGITKPAGVPVWYKVNIKDAKANTDQDVCVVVTNNGTKKLTLIAGQSLDCPSSGVTRRTIELAAGQTLRDTIPNNMLTGVAFDELYVSLENDQPITVTAEYANRPLDPVLPADPTGLVYTEKIVPDTSLHTSDVITLTAGQTYYFKYDVSKLNALKKYEPEFTFRNIGTAQATIERKMAFEVPAFSAQGNTLVLDANDESIEVLTKNTLIGLDASFIYVKITSDQDIQLISRFKHLREGKACKTNIDFDWVNGHTQSASTKLWYAIDVADARDNIEDIIVHVQNLGSKTASLDASVAFSCPYIDLQEMHHNIAAGTTEVRTLGYSTYAMMTDTIWIGVETNQDIKFWATTKPAQTTEPDEACLTAVKFNWEEGVTQNAGDTVWYKISMDEAREKSAKFPTVFVQNLNSTAAATITAELSLECPDSIANQKRTKTLAANESYSKQLSRNLFENIVQDTIYLKVITTQNIALQIRLNEEAEGASCSSAIPFNWVSGNSQNANDNFWYIVDLRNVMQQGNDIKLHIENRDNATCNGVAQLIYECPTASAPSVQDFKLGALAEKSITVQNSAFETLSDSVAYVNLQGTTGLRFWVELLPLKHFDTIYADGITLIPLQWDTLYTQTVDTAWYIIPNSEILKVRNMEEKAKPVAHLINLGGATTIKAEGAFAFPITKKMMTKSQNLKSGQHFTDTIPFGTFDQILKKDSIIIRVTRPVGSSNFQFRAELVNAFSGNSRADALPIRLGEKYIQQPNTEMWYKVNTADLKKDKNLFNKRLSVSTSNLGTSDAEITVSVFEGLLSNVDLLDEYGLGDYRQRTIKKGEKRERTIPAQAIYGVGDMDMYILVRSTGGLSFSTKFAGDYDPQPVDPKQAEAKLLVPNVEYVVPGDNQEHWYMVCLPYMQNNYIYTDAANLEYELNGTATIEATATFQDEMDCAMPVRQRTINKSGGYHKGTKPLRELIEKAIKKAGYTFDFSGTDPEFMDSLLHRYITKDSITAYVRIKTDKDLKVKLNMQQITGDQCTNPMVFDWEHGNVNPAGASSWYHVHLDSLIIPDTCDLRLHVDNWSALSSNIGADLYFDCNDPATVSKTYTLGADGKDSLDIDRDFLQKLGWADMIINYTSDYASHIWAELIPNTPRDTLRDTIVAYVCQGSTYLDTITNISYGPIDYSIEWYDTISFEDGVTMKDSVTLFQIHPLVMPQALTIDSMKKLSAAPLLVQGMQLFVDSSAVKLTEIYKNLGNSVDTIVKIDTVYWAKPVYSAPNVLDDTQEAALDLTSFYPKTQAQDTLLLVIRDSECGSIYRTDYIFPLEDYKYASKNDTICPPAPAKNPDTLSSIVLDTLNLPRYVDTIVTYKVLTQPALYTQAQLTPAQTPIVASGAAIDTTYTLSALKQQFEDDADDLTMKVTDVKWEVETSDGWSDDLASYTVPTTATSLSMRYIINTECLVPDTSVNIDFTLTPACSATYGYDTVPGTFCDSYRWTESLGLGLDTTITEIGTNTYEHTFVGANAEGCDSIISLTVTITQSYDTLVNLPVCESYYWAEIDSTIYDSGTYQHMFATIYGCDSLVKLNVNINHGVVTPTKDTIECGSFYWTEIDSTIYDSGIYSHAFTGVNGCDSVASYNVTILPAYNIDVVPAPVCESYYWAEIDSTIYESGTYPHMFTTVEGCDSLVTLKVTIGKSVAPAPVTIVECDSYNWKNAAQGLDTTIITSGTYQHMFATIHGCDSLVTLDVTINKSYKQTVSGVTNCISYNWVDIAQGFDTTITTSGSYTHIFQAANGCDSIITLPVTINQPVNGKDSAEQCYSYTWTAGDGKTYYNDTTVTYTYLNGAANGCDSTVTMKITVNNPYQMTLSLVSKYGDRLLMINRNEIMTIQGWNLDLENDTALVKWYKEDPAGDIFLGYGYYYTKNGEVLDPGVYYAVIDIPASEGAVCGSKGETVHYTVSGAAAAPALAPSLARPGEDIRVLNLDPDKETIIRVYTTEGLLQGAYTVSGETSFTIKAAYELGFYLVELNNDGMKTTLRYIVK
jgi:hypothetical protein